MSEELGERIGDRYELIAELARGGSSIVYRGFDHHEGQHVAVKVLHGSYAAREDFGVRMVREFRAMRLLRGTSAVTAYALAVSKSGALCLIMELLDGLDLDDYVARVELGQRRMETQQVVQLLGPVVSTLERGHDMGIIHRDLKPGNIFVVGADRAEISGEFSSAPEDPGGDAALGSPCLVNGSLHGERLDQRVRLLDYGFCRAMDTRSITPDGTVLGSPSYIPPEVWRGKASQTDPAGDVYSLGAIVFRLLAGRVPFAAETLRERLRLVCDGERPSLHALRPDLPPAIDEWVQQVLAVSPAHRFRRVSAMWSAFQHAVGVPSAPAIVTARVAVQ